MPLSYLLDEHFRGLLWSHATRHNTKGSYPLDVVRVGDPDDLPLGSKDPAILSWAEHHGRILVARDKSTLRDHLTAHLAAGRHSPGIFLVRNVPYAAVIDFLACAAYASEAAEWQDRIEFIP